MDRKRYAVQLMHQSKSFDYTRSYLERIEVQARRVIAEHGGNRELERIVDVLAMAYRGDAVEGDEGAA